MDVLKSLVGKLGEKADDVIELLQYQLAKNHIDRQEAVQGLVYAVGNVVPLLLAQIKSYEQKLAQVANESNTLRNQVRNASEATLPAIKKMIVDSEALSGKIGNEIVSIVDIITEIKRAEEDLEPVISDMEVAEVIERA